MAGAAFYQVTTGLRWRQLLNLIHCSYHKCLTVYFVRVMDALYNRLRSSKVGYRHFDSRIDDFYGHFKGYRVASVNNHSFDLERLGDFRITRFIRDPRDLVVSGYFYHKRGAEDWSNIVDPVDEDWRIVNGCVPPQMKRGQSFSDHLNAVDQENGLIAEIDFRAKHFNSMLQWPTEDQRIKVFRYEDVLGHEAAVFSEILTFYGVAWHEKRLGAALAHYYSANRRSGRTRHIRNPHPGQWSKVFTPKVTSYFNSQFGAVLSRYDYR